MADAWNQPKDVSFSDETLYIHGIDIGDELIDAVDAWNNENYEEVGYELGEASWIMLGNSQKIDAGIDPTKVDPNR